MALRTKKEVDELVAALDALHESLHEKVVAGDWSEVAEDACKIATVTHQLEIAADFLADAIEEGDVTLVIDADLADITDNQNGWMIVSAADEAYAGIIGERGYTPREADEEDLHIFKALGITHYTYNDVEYVSSDDFQEDPVAAPAAGV